jgi:predicted glutamine amidotransferase
MCRWLAYRGQSLALETILMAPEHSILDQSRHAERTNFEINGDGFGIGWYGTRTTPGVFHDVRPAWNDQNLRSVAAHIRSPLFMAHVRATTGSPVSRSNCHPFVHGSWLFVHNGQIGGFDQLKHRLDCQVSPAIYAKRTGTTDTETMFQLALTLGLEDDPIGGILRMIERVESDREKEGVTEPFHMTVALANGEDLWAFRHASDDAPPSLYYSAPEARLRDSSGTHYTLEPGSALVLSEPLDRDPENWIEVEPESRVTLQGNSIRVEGLF